MPKTKTYFEGGRKMNWKTGKENPVNMITVFWPKKYGNKTKVYRYKKPKRR